jgi:hypothetical protein
MGASAIFTATGRWATRREERVPIGQDAIDIESDLIDDMVDKGCA